MPRLRAALACLALCAVISPRAAAQTPDPSLPDARLRALYSEEWTWRQRELARTNQPGEAAAMDHFPRVDAASQQARHAYWTRALATLDSIPFDLLSAEEKVNAQVFRATVTALANDVKYRTYEAPFNSDTFFWTEFTPRQSFATIDAYRNYLGRLRDVPRYFNEQIANMRAGLARGYTVPRVSTVGRDKTIEPYVRADTTNPLYAAFTRMPASIPAADQVALGAEAKALIRDVVAPAYGGLLTMMRTEYLPKTRTTLAAAALPDGHAFYQAMIEKFTTLNLTAQQIHDIGLAEVARIQAEMDATKQRAGFTGSMAEFFTFLRTDPQFYAKTPRELLSYSAYISKKADGKLSQTIGFLPRYRHGILPVPDNLAPIYTGGRGGLESCLMNTYNLPARPLYTIPPLTLHECTPGHSFQAALALEGLERPPFRRGASFSAYTEGWGLYTEWLGTVMGIYETPYEDFGRLTYEMWRACRLVIDTGIHQFGWTREQAMEYLRTRAPLSEHEITTEVERYIAWPAQALAYKLGEIQIRRHRREAEEQLGAKFDQRKFHDVILALGAVPLSVLEQRMAQFIADGGSNPPEQAPPRFMYIYRDSLKQGVDSAYRAIEEDAARICTDLRCPNPYLALESLSGPHEAWWLNAFAGEADTTRVAKAYAANRPLMDALGTITKRKEAMIGRPISGYAIYRAELSRGPAWSVAGAPFMVVTVTRSRRPAEGSVWEMADSTLYVLRPAKTRGEAESLARGGARIFAVRPSWSMPAPEWVAADPGFWRPRAASP